MCGNFLQPAVSVQKSHVSYDYQMSQNLQKVYTEHVRPSYTCKGYLTVL
jgi:hypothetical protein